MSRPAPARPTLAQYLEHMTSLCTHVMVVRNGEEPVIEAVTHISREQLTFMQGVWTQQYYQQQDAWKFERQEAYRSGRSSELAKEDAMWTFEPHVAETIFRAMLDEAKVTVRLNQPLDRKSKPERQGEKLISIRTRSGSVFRGKQFIDATYEGDLMAMAGVSYHVGREANAQYGETLNGVQTKNAVKHQLMPGVDPYVKPGDPASGLLPGVHADGPGEEGAGDRRVQAYCFRMCVTDVAENRLPFEKPSGYDERRYELLLRNFEAGETKVPWSPFMMPNRKTDTNNKGAFSSDNIGLNYDYPDGDYATRERVITEHTDYTQGLLHFLATDDAVPDNREFRALIEGWGRVAPATSVYFYGWFLAEPAAPNPMIKNFIFFRYCF